MANAHTTLTALFTAIANAIRVKTGGTARLAADGFPDAIEEIQTGVDTSDADAAASDIRKGKTAYVKDKKVTGDSEVVQATPTIAVSTAGKITAISAQDEGFVSLGTKTATKQLSTYAGTTVTSNGTLSVKDKYCTGNIYVNVPAGVRVDGIEIGEGTPYWSIYYAMAFTAFCHSYYSSAAYVLVAEWDGGCWNGEAIDVDSGIGYGRDEIFISGDSSQIFYITIDDEDIVVDKWTVLGP